MTIINRIGGWSYKMKNIFAGSRLFHSETVEGKKEFFKKLYFTLKMRMLGTFLEV